MLQVAAPFWNKIAAQGLRSPFGEQFFRLNQEELNQAHNREHKRLVSEGSDPAVASAYLELAPLIAEPEAIRSFAQTNRTIREALPEVTSTREAVRLAIYSDRLNPTQATALHKMLEQLRSTRKIA
jgi:hypothetical protein